MTLEKSQGKELLAWARGRIGEELGESAPVKPAGAWCERPAATFVTLRWAKDGSLQGCLGGLTARRPLVDDVAESALGAAFHDPRTSPIKPGDLPKLDLEISILSDLEPIDFDDRAGALAAIRPGVDGIVLHMAGRRATFLPSMWEQLPTTEEFLGALKEKAGLTWDAWTHDTRLERYTVEKWIDKAS
jgi:AmmeMemoRadiSam system protein A